MANGVIETASGALLRASYGTVSPAAGAGETFRGDVPEPFKVRQIGSNDTYHLWDGLSWILVLNPGSPASSLVVPTLIADANDLVIPGFDITTSTVRMSGDVINRNVTGIVPPVGADMPSGGRYFTVLLVNIGAANRNLVFAHENLSSAAANRFRCPDGGPFTLVRDSSVYLTYDSDSLRWRFASR